MVTPPAGYEVGYVPIVTGQAPSMAVGCPAEIQADKTAKEAALINTLSAKDLVGSYKRHPVQNGWHEVTISLDNQGQLWWNNASTQWKLYFESGVLTTGEDCPYGVSTLKVELLADAQGVVYGLVGALIYNNESYDRVWGNAP